MIYGTFPFHPRKGGRVVEGAGLENRNTGDGIGGSNPFPSAIFIPLALSHWLYPLGFRHYGVWMTGPALRVTDPVKGRRMATLN